MHGVAEYGAGQAADEAPFRSTHQALAFALRYTEGAIGENAIARMVRKKIGTSSGLQGLDGAGQAGMVLAELERISVPGRWLLIGHYAEHRRPCECGKPCCQGWRESDKWERAVNALTDFVGIEGACGTVSRYQLRRALVRRMLGERLSLIELATRSRINRDTASEYYRKILDLCRPQLALSFHVVDTRLQAVGIVSP